MKSRNILDIGTEMTQAGMSGAEEHLSRAGDWDYFTP